MEWLRPIIKGEPSIIIHDGVLNIKNMKKNKLEAEQLRSMLRLQGIFSVKEVKYAILEPSGELSIMETEEEQPITPEMIAIEPEESALSHLIVDEGEIQHKVLKEINKTEKWLKNLLKEHGYDDVRDIFYAEWSKADGLTVNTYEQGKN